jgi:hypothetical protein
MRRRVVYGILLDRILVVASAVLYIFPEQLRFYIHTAPRRAEPWKWFNFRAGELDRLPLAYPVFDH